MEELRLDSAQLLLELLEMRQQAGYWKAQFQRSKEREAKLERKIEELEAKVKQLEHQLFGKKSEKKNRSEISSASAGGKRPRGQQVRQSRAEAAKPRASAAPRRIPRSARR